MKIMFLDESGDHNLKIIDSQYPVFCLAGVIADENVYKKEIVPLFDSIKKNYWGKTEIIFHSREIRKCEPPFNILLNKKTRQKFYRDINNFYKKSKITIISSVILKKKLKEKYSDPSNPYEISMMFLMERFLYFLEETNDVGYITIESRDTKSNSDLFEEYTKILNNGTGNSYFITPSRFQSRIKKIEFITKRQNEIGHQMADLVAYPIATKVLYPKRKNPAYDVLEPKLRQKNKKIRGYGLKIFP